MRQETELEPGDDVLDLLVTGVELTQGSRFLALVVCNSPARRSALLNELRERLQEERIGLLEATVDANHTSAASAIARGLESAAFQALSSRSGRVAVSLNWLESAIHPQQREDPDRTPTAIQQLNMMREYFVLLEHPVIFWLYDAALMEIARKAPDFYRIRTHTFVVREPDTNPQVWEVVRYLRTGMEDVRSIEDAEERMGLYARLVESLDGGDPDQAPVLLQLLNRFGSMLQGRGKPGEARALFQRALGVAKKRGDDRMAAYALSNIGLALSESGDLQEALSAQRSAYDTFLKTEDLHGQAMTLANMGGTYFKQGRPREALAPVERSLVLAERLGDHRLLAKAFSIVGLIMLGYGRLAEALLALQRAYAAAVQVGSLEGQAIGLANLGALYVHQGQLEQALETYSEALRIAEEIGADPLVAASSAGIGLVCESQGRPEDARRYLERSLALYQQLGYGGPQVERVRNHLSELQEPAPATD